MYRVDKIGNHITPLRECSFSELGFKERAHLQEWIANEPSALGEDLLIIQKEFSGFSDTNERLDLLALDKQGSLVIIENKLDDTGRDVTWQALKYASYCSGLARDAIRGIFQQYLDQHGKELTADDLLCEYFEVEDVSELSLNKGATQRIILIAANFRKEVTSTVLWLLNFRVRLQCFRARPFALGDDIFLNIEQIIPLKDTEEFQIGIADKAQEEVALAETEKLRHLFRRRFWTKTFSEIADKTSLYQSITPPQQSWTTAGSGLRGVGFNLVATKDHTRVELYIDRGDHGENKAIFDFLQKRKVEIEERFGGALIWERLDAKRASRIKAETDGNIYDEARWPGMIAFLGDAISRFEPAVRPALKKVSDRIKANALTPSGLEPADEGSTSG